MLFYYIIWLFSCLLSNINLYFWFNLFYCLVLLFWFFNWIFQTKIHKNFFLTVVLFFFIFFNVWSYSDLIFLNMVDSLGLKFIVKDPQDYINFKLVWSFFLATFCLIFFFIFQTFFLISGFVNIFFKPILFYFFWLYIFYFFGVYFIAKEDLLFSGWPDISSLKFLEDIFSVFPDFSRVTSTFISEFFRLGLFILNFLLLYFSQKTFILKMLYKMSNPHLKKSFDVKFVSLKKFLILRFFLSFFIFEAFFSFYGGENYLRDFLLFLASFMCVEILTFSFLFFFQLKYWKSC